MTDGLRPGLSILVPAYNEEQMVTGALQALLEAAGQVCEDFEVVVVDDGSADRTGEIIDALAAEDPRIRALHHERNQGIGGGITTAGKNARCQYAIVCPVDSPLSPEQIKVFLAAVAPDVIVVGYRPERLGYRAWQQLGSRVYHAMACALLGLRLRDVNWIHMYPSAVFRQVHLQYGGVVYLAEVLAKARRLGYRFVEVPSPMAARTSGVATISKPAAIWRMFRNLLSLWWNLRVTGRAKSTPSPAPEPGDLDGS